MEEKKIIKVGAIGFGFRIFGVFTLVQKQAADNIVLQAICDPHPLSRGVA